MRRFWVAFLASASWLQLQGAVAGTVSGDYTSLPQATLIHFTPSGTLDWVKWDEAGAIATTYSSNVRKNGVPHIIDDTINVLGAGPPGTTVVLQSFPPAGPPDYVLQFDWTDGDGPDSGLSAVPISESISPPQFDYPLGLGASMTAAAAADTRVLDVYVQGFNADMKITAEMSGGGVATTVVTPDKVVVSNNFSAGVYRIRYAGLNETLTVSVEAVAPRKNGSVGFPNAGFFAAAVIAPESADFDSDGDVDGVDLLIWQRGFGSTTGATRADGDADGNGSVNALDLAAWKSQFPGSATTTAAAAVPEPCAAAQWIPALLGGSGALASTLRRRR
ncbi:MAG: hypothetical protein DCC67_16560 [Planctomycetota bacterium]|nr:MAG: hypothetical protein DCC67_16560 [Planctomycetota bacterium]